MFNHLNVRLSFDVGWMGHGQAPAVGNTEGFGHFPEVNLHSSSNAAFLTATPPHTPPLGAVLSSDLEDGLGVQPGRVIRGLWFVTLFRTASGFEAFPGALSGLGRQFGPLTLANHPP